MEFPAQAFKVNELRDGVVLELTRDLLMSAFVQARVKLGHEKRKRAKKGSKTSRFTGVRYVKNRRDKRYWETQFCANGVHHRGYFADEIEAAKQYNTWCDEMAPYRQRNVIP